MKVKDLLSKASDTTIVLIQCKDTELFDCDFYYVSESALEPYYNKTVVNYDIKLTSTSINSIVQPYMRIKVR